METILLVDDSPTNLEVLFRTLDDTLYRILVARSGETALQIVAQEKPTLVLLDVMMPGMDGFEVCERIKADEQMKKTAVIFLSALGDTDAKVRGFQLGGVDYIAKPFQAEEVVARVATHVRIQQLERKLEDKNAALESEFRRILTSMAEGVYGLNKNGEITYLNTAASQLTGFSADELLGANVFEQHFQLDDDIAFRETQPLQLLSQGQTVDTAALAVARQDGSYFYADICLTPSFQDNKFLGGVMVFRDISERLMAEKALAEAQDELQAQRQRMAHVERLSTMGEMAAGFAHEVNQPLTAIANYASVAIRLLSNETIDEKRMEETLRKLQTQALRASEVIQRLREFAKTPKNNKVVKDINTLATSIIGLAEIDSRKLDIDIVFTANKEPAPVYIDEVQIQQVILNLVRNAMEATAAVENNKQAVVLQATVSDERVNVVVRDYGCGLDEDAEEHLFHPFYSTKADGMGIGLSICASIIQDHGGTINYQREEIGTSFSINLPIYT